MGLGSPLEQHAHARSGIRDHFRVMFFTAVPFLALGEGLINACQEEDHFRLELRGAGESECVLQLSVELHTARKLHEGLFVWTPELDLPMRDAVRFLLDGGQGILKFGVGDELASVLSEAQLSQHLVVIDAKDPALIRQIGAKCQLREPGDG